MNSLSNVLKKSSTLLVDFTPEDCPACGCPRFERIARNPFDKVLGRTARYVCIKCGKTTLQMNSVAESNAPNQPDAVFDGEMEACKKFVIGNRYAKGDGVKKNEQAAYNCFVQAAELGHSGAQVNVGIFLLRGIGAAQDTHAALEWFESAAKQGNQKALNLLPKVKAFLDKSGVKSVERPTDAL